jgi:methylmalonyl-CoA/ethylmalonyl-CoA epimerase
MKHIEHIGIAVSDIEAAIKSYSDILNTECYKRERVESQKVETAFFKSGPNKIELLGATDDESVITKFISKRGEGMHHVAFAVDDIEAEMKRLSDLGYQLLQEKPLKGADNKLVAFVHPKETRGVLLELCQDAG